MLAEKNVLVSPKKGCEKNLLLLGKISYPRLARQSSIYFFQSMVNLKKTHLKSNGQAEIIIYKTFYVAFELHRIFSTELFHLLQFGGIFNKQLFTAKQLFRFVFLSSMKRGRLFKTCRLVYYPLLSCLILCLRMTLPISVLGHAQKGVGNIFEQCNICIS